MGISIKLKLISFNMQLIITIFIKSIFNFKKQQMKKIIYTLSFLLIVKSINAQIIQSRLLTV